ncbi:MAG: ribosome biogenesis GTP-binding protein YihA/YsxC, partial [Ignavibacteria bacterium]
MKHVQADFFTGASAPIHFPSSEFPEIAFIGRSNVGKSSLINSIVRRKQLALTSSTPGKTQQINFFMVEQVWMLVDLPGFGYASVGKTKRLEFSKLNYSYLEARDQLKMVCLLLDSRHDPSQIDMGLIEWLEMHGIKYTIILTKCDKIKSTMIEERKEQIKGLVQFCSHCIDVLPYSSETGLGREQLWGIIKRESASGDIIGKKA